VRGGVIILPARTDGWRPCLSGLGSGCCNQHAPSTSRPSSGGGSFYVAPSLDVSARARKPGTCTPTVSRPCPSAQSPRGLSPAQRTPPPGALAHLRPKPRQGIKPSHAAAIDTKQQAPRAEIDDLNAPYRPGATPTRPPAPRRVERHLNGPDQPPTIRELIAHLHCTNFKHHTPPNDLSGNLGAWLVSTKTTLVPVSNRKCGLRPHFPPLGSCLPA